LILGVSLLNPSFTYALVEKKEQKQEKSQNIAVNPLLSSSSLSSKYSLLDPNPDLIDKDGNLINDINLAANITSYRIGTIADGVSKLILLVYSNNTLQFSINGTKPDNLINGALSSLSQSSNIVNILSSTATVTPKNISNGKSVVAAIYTPQDNIDLAEKISHRTVNIQFICYCR
jgi:hypothetical protein